MEFKNFENKLIIEKITNYCIENNINAQEINSLTAKIKFGKLNESLLLEVDPISAGLGGLALGAAGAAATQYGKKAKQFFTGFTATGKYKNAVEDIKDTLQTGIDSINKINSGLDPANPNNIFKTHKIDLDAKKTRSLVDAVKGLKDSLDSSSPQLKSALNDIGAEVSGLTSNYGDASTGLNFQFAFKDELDKITGIPDPGFKPDMKKRIISNLKINTSNIYAKLETPQEKENYLINLKTQLAKAIADINSTDNDIKQKGYIKLQALTTGNVSTAAAAPPKPAPANPGSNPNTIAGLISNNDVNAKIARVILSGTNLATITKIIQDAYDKGQSTRDISKLIAKASKQSATMKSVPSTITNKNAAATLLIKNIGYYLENPTAR
jgi:hypothetical protein